MAEGYAPRKHFSILLFLEDGRGEQEEHQGETGKDMEQMNKIRNMAREGEREKKGRTATLVCILIQTSFFNLIHTNPSFVQEVVSPHSGGNITIMIEKVAAVKELRKLWIADAHMRDRSILTTKCKIHTILFARARLSCGFGQVGEMANRGAVSPHLFSNGLERFLMMHDGYVQPCCVVAFTPLRSRGACISNSLSCLRYPLLTLSLLTFFSSLFAKILKPTPSIAAFFIERIKFTSCDLFL